MKFIPPKEKTKIDQNLIFNIFNPQARALFLIVFVCFTLISVFSGVKFEYFAVLIIINTLISAILAAIIALVFVLHCPHNIELYHNRIDFNDYAYHNDVFQVSIRRKTFVKIHCSVFNAEEFELKQNAIEKRFDIGHISFSGKLIVSCEEEYTLRNKDPNFSIYGIKNFSKFKETFFTSDT